MSISLSVNPALEAFRRRENPDEIARFMQERMKYHNLLDRMTLEEKVSQMRMFHANKGIYFSDNREILLAINDFQITTARILLAVGECDAWASIDTKANLRKEQDNFEQAWSKLKTVYSKTRFIANPDSYLMDGDKTHIAN